MGMLIELRIRNFALIDDVTLGLDNGLTVLTGETGAGKSIIITALSLVLGARPSGPLVRQGADSARIDAVFSTDNPALDAILNDAGIPPEEDGNLALAREFTAAGRSTARINGRAAPLSALRAAAERLADLHGQYAHQTLLRTRDHAAFLDAAGPAAHTKRTAAMEHAFTNLRRERNRLRECTDNAEHMQEQAEMLRFRIREIDDLITDAAEYDELVSEIKTLDNAQEIAEAVHQAYEAVSANGPDTSALNRVAAAARALDQVAGMNPQLDNALVQLRDAEAVLDTAARDLGPLRHAFPSDPDRLDNLQDRLFQIRELMKKTSAEDIHGLLDWKQESQNKLDRMVLDQDGLAALKNQVSQLEKTAAAAAAELTESRRKLAADLAKKIKKELRELAMPGAVFDTAFEPHEDGEPAGPDRTLLRRTGAERVAFLISTNPGEPPKPLAQIASGGELSRVMLAFKSLLHGAGDVSVLVFDEIDAGIGGETAHAVARKLAALATRAQVFSVTHLPQIAAAADHHVAIAKHSRAGRTVIRAQCIQHEDRLREMTRMLGATGLQESEDLARKMIEQAQENK